MRPRTILAIDPGLRELGYAVLAGQRILDANVVQFRSLPCPRRLAAACSAVRQLIERHQPTELVVEQAHSYPAGPHLLLLALRRLARQLELPLAVYPPQTVRKRLLGDGWAGKAEAAAAMCVRYPGLKIHKTQNRRWKERYWHNMFDAVALATHHSLVAQPPSRSRRVRLT